MTAPVPLSWAPVTIRPLPSASIRTNAPDGPGALNHQPEATPIASFGPRGPAADPLDRPREGLQGARALVPLSGRSFVAVAHEVAPAELDRVQPDAGGQTSWCCSIAQHACGPVGARTDPDGVRFV